MSDNKNKNMAADRLVWRPYTSDPKWSRSWNKPYYDSSGNLVIDKFSSETGVRKKIGTIVLEYCKHDT